MSERQQRGAEDLAFLLKPYLPKSWPEGQDWVGSHAGICSVTAVLGTGSESTVGEHSCRLSSHKGRGDGGGKGEEKRRKRATEAGQRGEAAFKRKPRRIRNTARPRSVLPPR